MYAHPSNRSAIGAKLCQNAYVGGFEIDFECQCFKRGSPPLRPNQPKLLKFDHHRILAEIELFPSLPLPTTYLQDNRNWIDASSHISMDASGALLLSHTLLLKPYPISVSFQVYALFMEMPGGFFTFTSFHFVMTSFRSACVLFEFLLFPFILP